jgi:hypothetical protein
MGGKITTKKRGRPCSSKRPGPGLGAGKALFLEIADSLLPHKSEPKIPLNEDFMLNKEVYRTLLSHEPTAR